MIKVRRNNGRGKAKLRAIRNAPTKAWKEAGKHLRNITPKDTGNARRKTRVTSNRWEMNYPYFERLDTGWSRQAPSGMTKHAINLFYKLVKKYMRIRR